jgi:O-antigen chain-terminating methyltransferase
VEGPVLDLGCGRGEFLGLLVEAGLDSYGIDESPELVEACRAAGYTAFRDDALTHLAGLPDRHLGGIFASHLIEHLTGAELWTLLRLAAAKIRPGGSLVFESPNPRVLGVTATTFWLDPTHQHPVHPDTAQFLLEQSGFTRIEVRYQTPFPVEEQLPRFAEDSDPEGNLERRLNRVIDRLNDLLLGCREYVISARRTAGPPPSGNT